MQHYLVMAMRNADFNQAAVAPHKAFLAELKQKQQLLMTGPFTDGSGGAYVVLAENLEQAQALVQQDPLHTMGASQLSVYEWTVSV